MFCIKTNEKKFDIIEMSEMEPGDIGIILEGNYEQHYVMRTLDTIKFEVMDLTGGEPNHCWTSLNSIKIELLPKGTEITLIVN